MDILVVEYNLLMKLLLINKRRMSGGCSGALRNKI